MTDVLVVAEGRDGELADINAELATAATELAGDDGLVEFALIDDGAADLGVNLAFEGVDSVHVVEHPDGYNADVFTAGVAALYEEVEPQILLFSHSVRGMDYAPATASELSLPILTKITAVSSTDPLNIVRKLYGSKVSAEVAVESTPVALTVWGGEFDGAELGDDVDIVEHDIDLDGVERRSRVIDVAESADTDVDITEADFIIAIGRGIEDEDNLDLVHRACEAAGGTIAASRPLVENGWFRKERQVGQSGQVVTPKVYLAVGISGAVEHLAGMKGSDTIIAINTDKSAPIFDVAQYGIVADLFEVLPLFAGDD